jgi:hypothetical protein
MKFSSQFDIHQTFDDFLVDLLYLKFELQYRIKIDVPEITIQTLADYIYFEKVFAEPKLHSKWVFRGQANEKWPLEASILRNINRSDTSIMNKQSIEKLYKEYELIDKYHNIFASSDLDYTFLSYMQHATSFSPFIDFTMNFIIATSFAMNNRSTVNDFFNNNSAIYCMPIIENQNIEQKIEEYRVGLLAANRNWSIEDLTILYQGMGTVYKPFADVTYSDDQTNDRMKYQKGIFILYENFISYTSSSVPYYFVNNMIKLVIHHSAKKEIYDYIYHHYQQYHQYFLMNPYQYFSE